MEENMKSEVKELYRQAKKVRKKAYVPYSNFKVGASILVNQNKIFTGCNIENASYGLTMCAERVAIFKAVSQGFKNIQILLLTADTKDLISPCGACRQVISEFGNNIDIYMSNLEGKIKKTNINKLLPESFNKGDF